MSKALALYLVAMGVAMVAWVSFMAISILHAQVLTPQPYVCMATVDTTYQVPAWQRTYTMSGAHCPLAGQLWVISDTDAKGTLYLIGGPK